MFDATPRLRDLLDLRTVLLVAVIAAGAFGLQLVFLAGTVASPLGGAIADFDRVPQVEGAPPEAVARRDGAEPDRGVSDARLTWQWPATTTASAGATPCLVYR
jgi:hypothetical protein